MIFDIVHETALLKLLDGRHVNKGNLCSFMIMEAKKRPSSTRSRMLDGGIYDYSGGL